MGKETKLINLENDLIYDTAYNRVEIIDENGRAYVNQNQDISLQLTQQDEGKTLKIFINHKEMD